MLVLSRKKSEGVCFDGPGRVVVVEICGDKVRLGFQADRSVTIWRDEVDPEPQGEKADAAERITEGQKAQLHREAAEAAGGENT